MKSEKEKMLAGELYDPYEAQLVAERHRARALLIRLNASRDDQAAERASIIRELVVAPTDAYIQPPFFCDYGTNIAFGAKGFMNFNCVVLGRCSGPDRRRRAVRACRATVHGDASDQRGAAPPGAGSGETDRDRRRGVDWRRRHCVPWGQDWRRVGDWRRQRGDPGYAGTGICGGQSLPGDSGADGLNSDQHRRQRPGWLT